MPSPTPLRRNIVLAVASLGASALLLSGCSSAAAPSEATGATRTVDTVLGEAIVPEQIDSVIVLEGRRDTDIVLALELPLVGFPGRDVSDGYDIEAPLTELLDAAIADGAEELFLVDEVNIEAIAQKAPTIVVSRSTEIVPIKDQLDALTTVVAIGNQAETTWQEDLLTVGEATGTTAKAEELIAEYDARVLEIQTTYAEQIASTKVVPLEYSSEKSDVGGGRLQSIVLADVGVLPAEAFAEALSRPNENNVEFSPEQTLTAYSDADAILAFVTTAETWAAKDEDDLWTALPAVVDGQVVRADRMSHDGGPITAMYILDKLEELYQTV